MYLMHNAWQIYKSAKIACHVSHLRTYMHSALLLAILACFATFEVHGAVLPRVTDTVSSVFKAVNLSSSGSPSTGLVWHVVVLWFSIVSEQFRYSAISFVTVRDQNAPDKVTQYRAVIAGLAVLDILAPDDYMPM